MFKKRHTKWIPFGNYNWANNTSYIVFVRKNILTGMMQFKTKRVNAWWAQKEPFVPMGLIDVKQQWDIITNSKTFTSL